MSKDKLLLNVLKGDWENVIKIYEENIQATEWTVNSQGQTALHIAVADSKEDVVQKFVEESWSLSISDKRGQTVLHLAASIGNVKICNCIAEADKSLLEKINNDGETPLLVAVHYGRREAFHCLAKLCELDVVLRRRTTDGKNILHVAILNQGLELANDIIGEYSKTLCTAIDNHGVTPLQTLATMPSYFRSSSTVQSRERIIYKSFWMVDLVLERIFNWLEKQETSVGSSAPKQDIEAHNEYCESLGEKIKPFFLQCGKAVCRFIDRVLRISKIREEEKKYSLAVNVANQLIKHSSFNVGQYYKDNETRLLRQDLELLEIGNSGDANDHDENQKTIMSQSSILISESSNIPNTLAKLILENYPEASQNKGVVLSLTCLAPYDVNVAKKKQETVPKITILTATKYGIAEIVENIIETHPEAVHEMDENGKNAVLIAVENRSVEVLRVLRRKYPGAIHGIWELDSNDNNALHLAALYTGKIWPTLQGDVMQLLLEFQWYKKIKMLVPSNYSSRHNKEGKTPREIFFETHNTLIKSSESWLNTTSTASSVVATLIATVAFTSCTTFPGGTGNQGIPNLQGHNLLNSFMVLSILAFCFSIVSLVMFLAIFLGKHRLERGFAADVAQKLIIGLVSLFFAVVSIFASFCSGQLFVLQGNLDYALLIVGLLTFLPLLMFTLFQYPFFVDVVRATFWNPF